MYLYIYLPMNHKDKLIEGTETHKMLTLLLKNYENMHSQMHQNTNERERIHRMIKELNERLSKSKPAV